MRLRRGRRRQEVHNGRQHTIRPDVLGRRHRHDRRNETAGHTALERGYQLLLGDLLPFQVFLGEIVIYLRDRLHQLLTRGLHGVREVGRDIRLLTVPGVVRIQVGFHGHKVHDAFEVCLFPNGQVYRHHTGTQPASKRIDGFVKISAFPIHHVDHGQATDTQLHSALPQTFRLHLHLGHGIDHHDHTLDNAQRPQRVVDEGCFTGRVYEVDLGLVPVHMSQTGQDRHLPLDLVLIVVHGGGAVNDVAQAVLGTTGEEQCLDE